MDEQSIQRIVDSAVQQAYERIIDASTIYQTTHPFFYQEVTFAIQVSVQDAVRSVQHMYEDELYRTVQQSTANMLLAALGGSLLQTEPNGSEK